MLKRSSMNPITFLFIVALGIAIGWFTRPPSVPAQSSMTSVEKDNEELTRLYQEDQSDRQPKDGKPIDWKVVEPRDKVREKRVKELYSTNQLRTGADYYHVAMVLQHASAAEDYLLAHELCVVAIT